MNKLLAVLTSLVGAKQVTFVGAVLTFVLILTLSSRREVSQWSNSLEDTSRVVPSTGSGVVNLESADLPHVDTSPGTKVANSLLGDSVQLRAPGSDSADPIASAVAGVEDAEFARPLATSSEVSFGPTAAENPSFSQGLAFTPAGSIGMSARIPSSGSVGAFSGGGSNTMGGETSHPATANAARQLSSPASQLSSGSSSVARTPTTRSADSVSDPRPALPNQLPVAAAPSPSSPGLSNGQNNAPAVTPAVDHGVDPAQNPSDGIANFGDFGSGSGESGTMLDNGFRGVDPLALPASGTDLPTGADLKQPELPPADHVPDSGHSLLLLGGVLVGLLSFRRWYTR